MHQPLCEHGTLRGLCTPGRQYSCGRIARGGGGVFALAQPPTLKTKPTIARPAQPRPHVQGAGDVPPLVARMLSSPDLEVPEGIDMLQLLKVTEAHWKALRHSKDDPTKPGPTVVKRVSGLLGQDTMFDVCVCGGTLGVLVGLALQRLGHRVCIVEKRKLEGRNQEWNIGREELQRLVGAGLLTAAEVEGCIVSEFNPVRVGLCGMPQDVWVRDVMNLGVQPRLLLDMLRSKFLQQGGALYEHTAFKGADVYDDGVVVRTLSARHADLPLTPGDVNRPLAMQDSGKGVASSSSTSSTAHPAISCRLVLDCMGHFGPIVKQIRGGRKPQGMVVVVGGCMGGVPQEKNASADLLYSFRDSEDDMQLFWEAFPAAGGDRTAYMFTYMDAAPERPTFASLLDTYFKQLPEYQGVPLEQLRFRRLLFGAFPCYPNTSPLPPAFDRVLQIGDAAAGQSPLSFGGFGSMVRNLHRLAEGLDDALQADLLTRSDLAWLQPYQPSLSAAWLFQRAMSVGVGQLQRQSSTAQQVQQGGAALPHAQHVQQGAGCASNSIVAAPGLHHEAPEEEQLLRQPQQQAASAAPAATPGASPALQAPTRSSPAMWHHSERAAPHAEACSSAPDSPWQQKAHEPEQQQQCTSRDAGSHPTAAAAAVTAVAAPSAHPGAGTEAGGSQGWLDPGHVNRLMRCNFSVMRALGDGVMRPFLQDSLRFWPLALTMAGMSFRDPLAIATVVRHLGVGALLDWTRHFLLLGLYTLLHTLLRHLKHWVRAAHPPHSPAATATAQQQGGEEGKAAHAGQAKGAGELHAAGGGFPWQLRPAVVRWRYSFLRLLDALACGSGAD